MKKNGCYKFGSFQRLALPILSTHSKKKNGRKGSKSRVFSLSHRVSPFSYLHVTPSILPLPNTDTGEYTFSPVVSDLPTAVGSVDNVTVLGCIVAFADRAYTTTLRNIAASLSFHCLFLSTCARHANIQLVIRVFGAHSVGAAAQLRGATPLRPFQRYQRICGRFLLTP